MKSIRILSLVLALLLAVCSLVACKKEPKGNTPDEEPQDQTVTLNLVTKSVTEYVIVRDYQADGKVVDAAATLQLAFKDFLGVDIPIRQCFNNIKDDNDIPTEKEILVGVTNRPESEELKSFLYSDYMVAVRGTKLVLGSISGTGTLAAVSDFLSNFVYKQGNRFEVSEGVVQSLVFTSKDNFTVDGRYSYSSATIMSAPINSFYVFYAKADTTPVSQKLANDVVDHIAKETGYELSIYKDSQKWADYEILVGNTTRSDTATARKLASNEYYVSLEKTTVTYEDGSAHDGVRIQILYGEDAADAAFAAFKSKILPPRSETGELVIDNAIVETNMQ